MDVSFTATLIETESGEPAIIIPDKILSQINAHEGDYVEFTIDKAK